MGDPPSRTNLCFGCRAITGAPLRRADILVSRRWRWEQFECERCGVTDVRPQAQDDS